VILALTISWLLFVAGGLLIAYHFLGQRTPALAVRIARTRGEAVRPRAWFGLGGTSLPVPAAAQDWLSRWERQLRQAGERKTLHTFLRDKLLAAGCVALTPLLPFTAATGHAPPLVVELVLAALGFFLPDLALRTSVKRRQEELFLDLPDALAVMALATGAGQSLRSAVELAARDTFGPLGEELGRALTLARRERGLDEREALVRVARETGEPHLTRFAELLAAKESPYLEFLRSQAAQARAEQNRQLERAADRAYLAMHAPVAPLLAAIVLLAAYGFLHFLAQTV
jgi:tight adherence protein C